VLSAQQGAAEDLRQHVAPRVELEPDGLVFCEHARVRTRDEAAATPQRATPAPTGAASSAQAPFLTRAALSPPPPPTLSVHAGS